LTTVYDEYKFTFGSQPLQKYTGKRQKKGLPICPFITQPAFRLLKQARFLLCSVGICGLTQALQPAVTIVYARLNKACHQAYSPVHLTFICARYNLLQIIEDIFVGAFAHGRGDLCLRNTNFPSIFLFPKFQRTISGFNPEKYVLFLILNQK
jgi:hypothetical protein